MQKQYNNDYNESKIKFSYIVSNTGIITKKESDKLFDLMSSDIFDGTTDLDVEIGIFLFLCSNGLDFDEVISYYNEELTIDKIADINDMIVNGTNEIAKIMIDLRIKDLI